MASRFGIAADVSADERLDLALTQPPFGVSRREAKRLLEAGRVLLNSHVVSVASRAVHAGDHIALLAPDVAVPIVHLDAELVVVDKPASLPTQPSPGSSNPSLLEVLASLLKQRGEKSELFLVHRLDTNTTGLIAFARNRRAADRLTKDIQGGAEKHYLAIARGRIDAAMTIEAPIGRLAGNVFRVDRAGKPARSIVTPIDSTDAASLVDVELHTGRTHQIRIHLAHAGHPIVGDRKYGSAEGGDRPMLHARSLRLPGRGIFVAEPPLDFADAAFRLGLRLPRG